ncbi:hypothetical protein D3C72_2199570 [compost metagenome]
MLVCGDLQKPDGSQHERGNHHEFATRVRQKDGRPYGVDGIDCQAAASSGHLFSSVDPKSFAAGAGGAAGDHRLSVHLRLADVP